MSIAYWIKKRIARERDELLEQGREIGRREAREKAFWESYNRGYDDALRAKARQWHSENSRHCPRSPFAA